MSDGGIPANIAKGPVHVAMDKQLNYQENGQYVNRPAIKAALEDSSQKYVDILRDIIKVPRQVVYYVADHWYNDDITAPGCWWKDKQPIEPVVRQSLIEAIDLAANLLIDSYWVPIGNRDVHTDDYPRGQYESCDYPFEVITIQNDLQVTRLIMTPPSPRVPDPTGLTQDTNIWVTQKSTDLMAWGNTKLIGNIAVTQLQERRAPSTS